MKEIQIFANPDNSSYEKGTFFEGLIAQILERQRYRIVQRVNFTGMEIDLICQHLERDEKLYVECKARDTISTNDIKIFCYDVDFKGIGYGYYIYTKSYGHQVAGHIDEIKKNKKNITFINGEKVIELLIDSKLVKKIEFDPIDKLIAKEILLYSYLGIFFIYLLSDSTIPEYFTIFDARNGLPIEDENIIKHCKEVIIDINTSTFITYVKEGNKLTIDSNKPKINESIQTVAELQESEDWDDYKPASSKYFVGRKRFIEDTYRFFNNIIKHNTAIRIFYIDGKSGWGKSSLLNMIKGKSRTKFYKDKFFPFVVDSRSALTENFVALSYQKMIAKAIDNNFLLKEHKDIAIPSVYNILDYNGINELTEYLENNNKLLILIFDQFEDIFRKGNLFESFYKFLMDVNNKTSNIVLGFSWKSEINISIDHPAYYQWQQAKDYTERLTLDEFAFSESKAIVKQLERSIGVKLEREFSRKIIDNAQGYPWLVKKLCIHISKQYKNFPQLQKLYDQDFNVESLFKDDLENLNKDETIALEYIAKRAYSDNAFEVAEIDESINEPVINSLLNKRMIIKSGTKYNIYWDIFRDFIVTKEIPKIGENYLIRQFVPPVLEMFLTFKNNRSLSLNDILNLKNHLITEGTIGNQLRELRNIGLITLSNNQFIINNDIEITQEAFRNYLNEKLRRHSIYYEVVKNNKNELNVSDLKNIIRNKFKGVNYTEKTLFTYIQMFINWMYFANIELPQINEKAVEQLKKQLGQYNIGKGSYTPQTSPTDIIEYFININKRNTIGKLSSKEIKILSDLKAFGLMKNYKDKSSITPLGSQLKQLQRKDIENEICRIALKKEKINTIYTILENSPSISQKELGQKINEILIDIKSEEYKNKAARILKKWALFISINKNPHGEMFD